MEPQVLFYVSYLFVYISKRFYSSSPFMHNRKITKSLQNMMKQSGEPYDHSYPLVVKKIQIFLLNLLFFKIYAIAIFAHLPVTSRRTRGSIIGKILSKSFRKKGPAECIISERNVPELINAKSALVAAT